MYNQQGYKNGYNPNNFEEEDCIPKIKKLCSGKEQITEAGGIIDSLVQKPGIVEIQSPIAGYITLRETLPADIALPVVEGVKGCARQFSQTENFVLDMALHLRSLTYYHAAKQLYSTLRYKFMGSLASYETVFRDDIKTNTIISGALAIIGDYETDYGKMIVKYPSVLIKRWILMGNSIKSNSESTAYKDASRAIFKDEESKQLIDDLIDQYIANPDNTEFETQHNASCSIPNVGPIDLTKSIEQNLKKIAASHPNQSILKNMIQFRFYNTADYLVNPNPTNIDFNLICSALDLVYLDKPHHEIMKEYSEITVKWCKSYSNVLVNYCTTASSPTTESGTPAQLFTSEQKFIPTNIKIENTDKYFGYMLKPASKVEYNPQINYLANFDGPSMYSKIIYKTIKF